MLDDVGPHCHGTCQACHSPQTARRQQAEPTGLVSLGRGGKKRGETQFEGVELFVSD